MCAKPGLLGTQHVLSAIMSRESKEGLSKVFASNHVVCSKQQIVRPVGCVPKLHLIRPGFTKALWGGTTQTHAPAGILSVMWLVPALIKESRLSKALSSVEVFLTGET